MRTLTCSLCLHLVPLACLSWLAAGCGDSSATGIADGTYSVVSGSCRFDVDGALEFPDRPYEISVTPVDPDDADFYPEGCIARITLRTETCDSGCAPTNCEACLREGGGAFSLTRAFEDESVRACSSLERLGGLGSDLLFDGAVVSGALAMSDVGEGIEVSLVARGEASYGIRGEDLPAEFTCDLTATPTESR